MIHLLTSFSYAQKPSFRNLNAPGIKGVSIKLVSQRGAGGLRLVLGYKDLNRGNPIRKINQQISGINTMERPKTPTSRMKDEQANFGFGDMLKVRLRQRMLTKSNSTVAPKMLDDTILPRTKSSGFKNAVREV